jgi:hypothetical protein
MTMYGSQTILESSQAPPPNNCLRSVHCHYRSLYLIYYYVLPTESRPFRFFLFSIARYTAVKTSCSFLQEKIISKAPQNKRHQLLLTLTTLVSKKKILPRIRTFREITFFMLWCNQNFQK